MSKNTLRKFLVASCGVIFGALAFSAASCSVKAAASGSSDVQAPYVLKRVPSDKLNKFANELYTVRIGKKSHVCGLDQLETYYTIKRLRDGCLLVSIYQNHCFAISHIFPNEWALNMAIARYLRQDDINVYD